MQWLVVESSGCNCDDRTSSGNRSIHSSEGRKPTAPYTERWAGKVQPGGTVMERRLAAVVAADMVGYSRLMETDEDGILARQKSYRKELRPRRQDDWRRHAG